MALKYVLKAVKLVSPKPNLKHPRLVSIGLSHFAEKARWGLDLSPLQFYEEVHCPAMHLSTTLLELLRIPRVTTWSDGSAFQESLSSRGDQKMLQIKEKSAVPKLVLPKQFLAPYEDSVVFNIKPLSSSSKSKSSSSHSQHVVVGGGASGILKFLSDVYPKQLGHLYPSGELGRRVLDLEAYLDRELASSAMQWSFGNLLLSGPAFSSGTQLGSHEAEAANSQTISVFLDHIAQSDAPAVERFLMKLGGRSLIPLMCKANNVSAESREKAREVLHSVFQHVDGVLQRQHKDSTSQVNENVTSSLEGPRHIPFIFGTALPTAADISLAALSAPILMPPEMGALLISADQLETLLSTSSSTSGSSTGEMGSHGQTNDGALRGCENMLAMAVEMRQKYASARLALQLYEEHRFSPRSATCSSNSSSRQSSTAKSDVVGSEPVEASGPGQRLTRQVVRPRSLQSISG